MWMASGVFIASPVLAAPDDLTIEFETAPLFNEANFLPGLEVSRWAKVKNNTSDTRPMVVETINENDPDGLADVFEIGIYESGIQRYGTTTLAAFFAAGEISLSNIPGGGTERQYDFLVRFVSSADNSYQEKSLGFDLLIGFKGDEGGGDGDGGEEGGGGGGGISGLVIQNEAAVIVANTSTSATIIWNTSFNSTSRVVYGATSGVFDFSSPSNYGYDFSTDEFDTPANLNGVMSHSVILTGLTPGTTYYYRVISHASPDTISIEHTFTMPASENVNVVLAQTGPTTGEISRITLDTNDTDEEILDTEEELGGNETDTSLAAAAILGFELPGLLYIGLALLLFLVLLFQFIYKNKKNKSLVV